MLTEVKLMLSKGPERFIVYRNLTKALIDFEKVQLLLGFVLSSLEFS
jgi:hypothetical protein